MKLRLRKSDLWRRSPGTIYLELIALALAGTIILILGYLLVID